MAIAPLDALIVAYAFPPVGGAGVARVLKLVKYLPTHGVTPSVLTVANPSVPVLDHSRDRDVAPELEIVKARTLEPSYAAKAKVAAGDGAPAPTGFIARAKRFAASAAKAALVPDAQVLWQPGAQLALARRLLFHPPDVVFISGPPFSTFMLAPLARLRPGVGVVLDYRDEWSTWRTTYENASRMAALVGGPLERALLSRAHVVTTATAAFRKNLLAEFDGLVPERVHAIPNGYDPDDIPARLPAPPIDKFVVTYAGTIFKLTSARGLIGAVRRLHREHPELAKWLQLDFIGRIVDAELPVFAGTETLGVRRLGYVAHAEVARALAASHLVLCLLDEVPGAERIYPAKIFELMAMQRPTLTLSPPGELATLVTEQRMGDLIAPRDEVAIARVLERHLRDFVSGKTPPPMVAKDAARYHRRALAGEFAQAFEQARTLARR